MIRCDLSLLAIILLDICNFNLLESSSKEIYLFNWSLLSINIQYSFIQYSFIQYSALLNYELGTSLCWIVWMYSNLSFVPESQQDCSLGFTGTLQSIHTYFSLIHLKFPEDSERFRSRISLCFAHPSFLQFSAVSQSVNGNASPQRDAEDDLGMMRGVRFASGIQ